MPIRVQPEASHWEFRGSPNVDSLRLRVKDPNADYWLFDETNPDYLTQSDSKTSDFVPDDDFTLLVRCRIDTTPNDHNIISKFNSASGQHCWDLRFNSSGNFQARISFNGTTWQTATATYSWSATDDVLVALVYDKTAGTLDAYLINSGGTLNGQLTGLGSSLHDSTANVVIAAQDGLGSTEWPDRIYWWGYTEQTLTQTNLEDLFDNHDVHPMDFDCKAYDDFNDTVAATHTTLIGGYTFSVTGTPVHNGDQGPSWPDQTRLFEPDRWGGDLTVMGTFTPDQVGASHSVGILGKWNENGVDERCWLIYQNEDDVVFTISKNGTAAGTTTVTVPSVLTAGIKSTFAMRYQKVADGTSELRCEVDGTEVVSSVAVSPIFRSNEADFLIANYEASTAKHFDGDLYWLAIWLRRLTDTEVDNITNDYYVKPVQYKPDYYDDFHDTVGAEKESTLPGDNTRNPGWIDEGIVFDVEGAPVQSGSTESTVNDFLKAACRFFVVEEDDMNIFSLSHKRRTYPYASRSKLGPLADPSGADDLLIGQMKGFSRLTRRTYPPITRKKRGRVVTWRLEKK